MTPLSFQSVTVFNPRPESITSVEISGQKLTLDQVIAVARGFARVHLAPSALVRVSCCRKMVDVLLEQQAVVYGLTTGFGKLRDVIIDVKDSELLQRNLIRSHAAGVGQPLPEDTVRAAVLLRANTLARGNSGIRAEVLQSLIHILNDRIYPLIPDKGSVGASGDLAPLSHLALVLTGDPAGRIYDPDLLASRSEAVREPRPEVFIPLPTGSARETEQQRRGWKFRPVELQAKEGLALNNGTQIMCAIMCLAVYDAFFLLRAAEIIMTMSLEAQRGVLFAFRDEVHLARPLEHQLDVARRIRRYTAGSEILGLYLNSAYLNRAVKRLTDAKEDLENPLHHHQIVTVPPDEVQRCAAQIDAHIAAVRKLLLAAQTEYELLRATGRDAPPGLPEMAESEARRQISIFSSMLRPLRRQVAATYQDMQDAAFPPTLRANELMAEAIRDLDRAVPAAPPVQDDYSFRCFPQVLACAYRALDHVHAILRTEINSATDNPLLFPPEPDGGWPAANPDTYAEWLRASPARIKLCLDNVIGGGNFHGEPIAVAADYLAITIAEAGSISERRIAHLVDENISNGLPGFLIPSTGLNSGFMIPQYTAAALVSENKVLAHPASVDSIPTCANSEDHVSMGTIAARKCAEILDNVTTVIAIELLAAHQALQFRLPFGPGEPLRKLVHALTEWGIETYQDDRVLWLDIELAREVLRKRRLWEFSTDNMEV